MPQDNGSKDGVPCTSPLVVGFPSKVCFYILQNCSIMNRSEQQRT